MLPAVTVSAWLGSTSCSAKSGRTVPRSFNPTRRTCPAQTPQPLPLEERSTTVASHSYRWCPFSQNHQSFLLLPAVTVSAWLGLTSCLARSGRTVPRSFRPNCSFATLLLYPPGSVCLRKPAGSFFKKSYEFIGARGPFWMHPCIYASMTITAVFKNRARGDPKLAARI